MSIYDIPVKTLAGEDSSLGALAGKTLLVVNVASKCGLTPQYTALEELHARLAPRGFSVVGFPCNQFGGQEPGTARGDRGVLLDDLRRDVPDVREDRGQRPGTAPGLRRADRGARRVGDAGDIQWNFEKFVIGPDGAVVARFRPRTVPDDPEVLAAIEASLPG